MTADAPQEGAAFAPQPPRRAIAFVEALSRFATRPYNPDRPFEGGFTLTEAIALAFEEVTREDDELLTLLARASVGVFDPEPIAPGSRPSLDRARELLARRLAR